MKNPCKVCPYKRNSFSGCFGDASGDPEEFLQQLELPQVHPCHSVIKDWDDEKQVENARCCTGALQFMNNSLKTSRYKAIAEAQKEVGKNSEVFNWKHEFVAYHSKKK